MFNEISPIFVTCVLCNKQKKTLSSPSKNSDEKVKEKKERRGNCNAFTLHTNAKITRMVISKLSALHPYTISGFSYFGEKLKTFYFSDDNVLSPIAALIRFVQNASELVIV